VTWIQACERPPSANALPLPMNVTRRGTYAISESFTVRFSR
jgi:hypothetical protein